MRHLRWASRGDDDGLGMVEVVVAMSILAVVMTATAPTVLKVLATSQTSGGRVVASGILRSAMEALQGEDAADILPGPVVTTQVVRGVTYTVTQSSSYVDLKSVSGDLCDGSASGLSAKRVVTAVQYPTASGVTSVQGETVRTVTGGSTTGGSFLAVKLTDSAATALLSSTVRAVSALGTVYDATTDALGCAVIALPGAGTFAVSATIAGKATASGTETATLAGVTVSAGATTRGTLTFDTPRSATLAFDTGATRLPAGLAFVLSGTTLAKTTLPSCGTSTGIRCLTSAPGQISNLTADTYSVQAGPCTPAVPSSATVDLRTATSASVTLPLSTVRVVVRKTNGTAITDGRTVTFTRLATIDCLVPTEQLTTTVVTGSDLVALPYGTWTVSVPTAGPASLPLPLATLVTDSGTGTSPTTTLTVVS